MEDRVLVVDDEETLRMVISQVLQSDGLNVTVAENGERALELFRQNPFPMVITDIVMGKMSGIDLLEQIKAIDETALVIIMTSHASAETAIRALRHGAYDYLIKPFDDIELVSAVARRAREKRRLTQQNLLLVEQLKNTTQELQSLNSQLRETASRDGLTGLYNHRSFRQRLDNVLGAAKRNHLELSLIMMDVDHFKRFNDTHGHLQGDECLRQVAGLIESLTPSPGFAARYGGEEFIVLLPATSVDSAMETAETIRSSIAATILEGTRGDQELRVTVSAGVASFPADGETANSLIEAADRRLYRAKHAGRNRVCSDDGAELRSGTLP